jgi:hypothetical protein
MTAPDYRFGSSADQWPERRQVLKNKTTKTGFVVELHKCIPDVLSSFIEMRQLFLLGGLLCLLCRGFLRRHEYITPFPLRSQY